MPNPSEPHETEKTKTPYTKENPDTADHHIADEPYKSPYVTTEPGAEPTEEKSPYTYEKPEPDKADEPFKSPYTTPEKDE
ncbi:MAG: hypothetical protein KC425_24510 [Anaerolineales bacterium]|nr:hypothetical protein [Anaerolineales bacterium]